MEQVDSINPKRIAWCCDDYGITPSDLAADVGLSATSMDRLMTGKPSISFDQLQRIADYFGRGALFFLDPAPVDEKQVRTAQFRTLANRKPHLSAQVKALIERVEAQRAVFLSLRDDLDGDHRNVFKPPELPAGKTRRAAQVVRDWLELPTHNTFESYRAALEARGILVFRTNGYNGKWQIAKDSPVLGFALYHASSPVIVVKKMEWESRQTFTLMHELGHILLHRASWIDDVSDFESSDNQEREANKFAGHLLVPDEFLGKIDYKARPEQVEEFDEWLAPQRKAWGVSTEVILRRLLDDGRLSDQKYTAYRSWRTAAPIPIKAGGSRAFRHREPRHIFGDTFVRTVLDALDARHITLAKASGYLDSLKVQDVHQLERFYAGT